MKEKRDPVEHSFKYLRIRKKLEAQLEEEFARHPRGIGFCHCYWARKKAILQEQYGINWRSPAEMNPWVIYD